MHVCVLCVGSQTAHTAVLYVSAGDSLSLEHVTLCSQIGLYLYELTLCVCVCTSLLDALCLAVMNESVLFLALSKSLRSGAAGIPEPHTNGRLLYLS